MTRVRLELTPLSDDGDRRRWLLRIDGVDVGWLDGVHERGTVGLSFSVVKAARSRGVVAGAVGRILGLAPWGSDVTYVLAVAPSDGEGAQTARSVGFAPAGTDAQGNDVWRRAAPRPRPAKDDIARFLDAAGRIDRYPAAHGERRDLLRWVAERTIGADEVLAEDEVNERLLPYAPDGDVAVLRRHLVDHELLERTPSGSQYARVAD